MTTNTLHELLCNLNTTASDIANLQTSLQIIEHSPEAEEDDLRAALNMTILYLSALEEAVSSNADTLDGFILESRKSS